MKKIVLFIMVAFAGVGTLSAYADDTYSCYFNEQSLKILNSNTKGVKTPAVVKKSDAEYLCCANVNWGKVGSEMSYYNCSQLVKKPRTCEGVGAVPNAGCNADTTIFGE